MGLWYPGVSLAGDVGAEGGEVLLKRFFLGIPDHPERLEGGDPLWGELTLPVGPALHGNPLPEPDLPLAVGLGHPGMSLAGDVGAEGGEVLLERVFQRVPDHPERLEGDGPLRAERPLPASDSLHVDPPSEL